MKKNRRQARELALSVLYACEMRPAEEPQLIFNIISENNEEYSEENVKYSSKLFRGVRDNITELDNIISKFAKNWDIGRMAAIDRTLLRMAITEFSKDFNIPYKVVIDEAVELAKQFGAEESGKFVNGLLDNIYREKFKS